MQALTNGLLTVIIGTTGPSNAPGYYVQAMDLTTPAGRHRLLEGEPGREVNTKAHRGIARGGQCCRMPDYPLLYPIGPAKAMTPLLDLYDLTGDPLFARMAAEAAACIGYWQVEAPGQPWDGGMIHALGQFCGKPWGPDFAGQVDTGMATGNSLAALEAWIARELSKGEW